MSQRKYIVGLSEQERQGLLGMVKKGKAPAYRIRHANILLKADAEGPNWPDHRVAEAFGCHVVTVASGIGSLQTLARETRAWHTPRNASQNWSRLAIHNRGRPYQTATPLPKVSKRTAD